MRSLQLISSSSQVSMMMKLPCRQLLLHLSSNSHQLNNSRNQGSQVPVETSLSPLVEETTTTKSPTMTRACFEDKNS